MQTLPVRRRPHRRKPLSPRNVLLAHYVKPPCVAKHLDIFVESMLTTRTGDDH